MISLLDFARLDALKTYLEQTEHLEGVVAEVGVFEGGSANFILSHTLKHVLLFDTFKGFPDVMTDLDDHKKGEFAATLDQVRELLRSNGHINFSLFEGLFPEETGEYAAADRFSLVHLDVDLYKCTKDCLEFFYPRMVPGGIIVIDDYITSDCRGVKVAVDEFFADKPEKPSHPVSVQVMVVKA